MASVEPQVIVATEFSPSLSSRGQKETNVANIEEQSHVEQFESSIDLQSIK